MVKRDTHPSDWVGKLCNSMFTRINTVSGLADNLICLYLHVSAECKHSFSLLSDIKYTSSLTLLTQNMLWIFDNIIQEEGRVNQSKQFQVTF